MWVVLVVAILNKASDKDRQNSELLEELGTIPKDLSDLFRDILMRDSDNRDKLVSCIQWVLFASWPLHPVELYYAILLSTDPDAVSDWDPEETTEDTVKRFILDSSKGLTKVTVSEDQTVQFIHESIRDFLLKENGLGKIWPELGSNFEGESHERLKQCCQRYVSLDVSEQSKFGKSVLGASSRKKCTLAIQSFPFLKYAVENVLHHADMAEQAGICQTEFLAAFPLPYWVDLKSLIYGQDCFFTKHASLLYVLAQLDLANLLGILPSVDRCMKIEEGCYGCPLFAAAASGSTETFQVCLNSIGAHHITGKGLLLDPNVTFKFDKILGFLLNAVSLVTDDVLAFLVDLGRFDLDCKDLHGRTVLFQASYYGCATAVERLLIAGSTMINQKDEGNESPLYCAALTKEAAVVRILLDNGADPNLQGGKYGSALQVACAGFKGNDCKDIVMMLLDKGANVNAQGGDYGNALQAAVLFGHKDVVRILRDHGALDP